MRINSPKGAGDGKEVNGVSECQNEEPTKMKEPLKVKEVFVGKWTLWYMDASAPHRCWQEGLQELASTATLESFWTIHKYLQPPSQMLDGADYSFFREKIKPMWEDRYNVRGGRWVCRFSPKKPRAQLDAAWLSAMLALGTGYFGEKTKHICGVVFSSRSRGHKLSLWTRNSKNVEVNEHLGRQFRELLKLSDGELTSYRYESFECLTAERKARKGSGKETSVVVGSSGERASGSGRGSKKSSRALTVPMDAAMIAGFSPPPKTSNKSRPNPDNLTEEEIRSMLKKKLSTPETTPKSSDQESGSPNGKKRGKRGQRKSVANSSGLTTTPSTSASVSPKSSPSANKSPKKTPTEKQSPKKAAEKNSPKKTVPTAKSTVKPNAKP